MPKLVSELTQGQAFSRSADGGQLADTATRAWRVVLNAPNEFIYLDQVTGVSIGDPYSEANPIPCVGLDMKADGESRMVRIITATYHTMAGGDGQDDPGTISPELRPALFTTSTSLYETPAYSWTADGTNWTPVVNSCGDVMDGITKLEPITTIRVTQFELTAGTQYSGLCGSINSETMSLGGYMTCVPHTVMFRGVEAQPHVESFGAVTMRGFVNVYEFAYRRNPVHLGAAGIEVACGWDATPVLTGFNVRAFLPQNAGLDRDVYGQPLKFQSHTLADPLALPDKINAGDKVRAMVRIMDTDGGGDSQLPSAQPIALNEDGTPRLMNDTKNPIIWRRQVQPDINLTSSLNLRLQ